MLERNIEENRKKQKREKHSLAGKIICGDCGWRYKKKSSGESWVCTKSGTAGHKCESYPITESAIEKTFVVLYNKLQQNIDNDYMKQYNNTGGDKTKYIECIQQTSEKIRLLRIELDTAKAKIAQNEKINQEVERLTKWLTEHDISFESYDDVVVRRMVELIRVNNDNTITVFSKFGSEVVENL